MEPGVTRGGGLARGQSVTTASLILLIADVRTKKWNFLLEEHNKLSEMPTLLVLYHATVKP